IAVQGAIQHWVEPWYLSYAILGALASGLAVILIPLVVTRSGGTATHVGAAIAAQNVGALFAPLWGWIADRSRAYRGVFFGGFVLIAFGFLGFTLVHDITAWHSRRSLWVSELVHPTLWRVCLSSNLRGSPNGASVSAGCRPSTRWDRSLGWRSRG